MSDINGIVLYRFYNILNLLLENGIYTIEPTKDLGLYVSEENFNKSMSILLQNNIIENGRIKNDYLEIDLECNKYKHKKEKEIVDNTILENYI